MVKMKKNSFTKLNRKLLYHTHFYFLSIGTVSNNLEIKNMYEKFLKDYEKYL